MHHLDGDRFNLWDWNLVPLCLVDHGLVEREVHVDREQLAMFGSSLPLAWAEAGGTRLGHRGRTVDAGRPPAWAGSSGQVGEPGDPGE